MSKNDKVTFLLASIADIQNSIRALDTKVIAIIVLVIFPLSQIAFLYSVYEQLIKSYIFFGCILLTSYLLCWSISFIFLFLCILSINNPSKQINNDCKAIGLFYGLNSYKTSLWDFSLIKSTETAPKLSEYINSFSDFNIENELIYEQMKLIYIRDLKSKRQGVVIILTFINFFIVFISWFTNKI